MNSLFRRNQLLKVLKKTHKRGFINEFKDEIKAILLGTTSKDFGMPESEWKHFVGFIMGRHGVLKEFQKAQGFGAYSQHIMELIGSED